MSVSRVRVARATVAALMAAACGAGIGLVPAPAVADAVTQQATAPIALNAVHIVLDISGSMAEDDGTGRVKMEGAKSAVLQFLDGIDVGTAVGLRTYPDQSGGSCNDGRLRYPVERHDPADVAAQVRSVQPDGDTPTAEALLRAAEDVRQSGFPAATLILVSDGESTCGDPCAAAADIAGSGIDLDVIMVGFQISDAGREELQCISSTMGGRYIDIDDGERLRDIFEDLSVPRLQMSLSHPSEVVAEVGFESSGIVTISATVVNESQTQATNVQLRLAFETAGPGVVAPVRAVGNLDPSAGSTVTWTFRPGLLLANTTVTFAVVARADNLPTDIGKSGSVLILDPNSSGDAGDLLTKGPLAILGDSYSAGEGTDEYFEGTDTPDNTCHRSRLTYAVSTFQIADEAILACSGAVASQISGPDYGNNIPSQTDQLADLQRSTGPVQAVLMSIGGNDVGFRQLAESCVFPTGNCSQTVAGVPADEFVEQEMATLPQLLLTAYGAVHATLNSASAVADRGGVAPIIVMAYPRPAPSVARACEGLALPLPVGDTSLRTVFDAAELTFVNEFITRLNGEIEGAVEAARTGPDRLPVYFVPYTEDSFLPDHTACDRQPYARGLDSFNGAALHFNVTVGDLVKILISPQGGMKALIVKFGVSVVDWIKRGIQELFHPNADGYRAMTRALIRWSVTSEATGVDAFLASVPVPDPQPSCPLDGAAPRVLGLGAGLGSLARCSIYEVRVTGHAPGTTVTLVVESTPTVVALATADADGTATLVFALPADLPPGEHRLVVDGVDDAGSKLTTSSSFTADPPGGPLLPWFLGGAAGAFGLAALVLWYIDRRRRPRDADGDAELAVGLQN